MQVYSHANDAHQQGITTKKQTYAALFPKSWRTSISLVHCCNLLLGSKVWPAIIKKKKSFFLVFFFFFTLLEIKNKQQQQQTQKNNKRKLSTVVLKGHTLAGLPISLNSTWRSQRSSLLKHIYRFPLILFISKRWHPWGQLLSVLATSTENSNHRWRHLIVRKAKKQAYFIKPVCNLSHTKPQKTY